MLESRCLGIFYWDLLTDGAEEILIKFILDFDEVTEHGLRQESDVILSGIKRKISLINIILVQRA